MTASVRECTARLVPVGNIPTGLKVPRPMTNAATIIGVDLYSRVVFPPKTKGHPSPPPSLPFISLRSCPPLYLLLILSSLLFHLSPHSRRACGPGSWRAARRTTGPGAGARPRPRRGPPPREANDVGARARGSQRGPRARGHQRGGAGRRRAGPPMLGRGPLTSWTARRARSPWPGMSWTARRARSLPSRRARSGEFV